MRSGIAALMGVLTAGCATQPAPQSRFIVTSHAQGLMALDPSGEWQIYRSGDAFPFEVNGKCTVAGESKPCMWHGSVVSFKASSSPTILKCVTKLNSAVDVVTPDAVQAKGVQEFAFDLPIDGLAGTRRYPGYTVEGQNDTADKQVTTCRLDGRVVLRSAFTVLPKQTRSP